MSLESKDEIAKAIGADSLENLTEDQVIALAQRLGDVPPELQLELIKTLPQLKAYALRAVAAVEDDLRVIYLRSTRTADRRSKRSASHAASSRAS